ncbi:MAG: hypothetical protein KKE20_06285 [Nanoarchaeota archaeon]|nr:hypothetical protein [Nanoarchaeota archaeon]
MKLAAAFFIFLFIFWIWMLIDSNTLFDTDCDHSKREDHNVANTWF